MLPYLRWKTVSIAFQRASSHLQKAMLLQSKNWVQLLQTNRTDNLAAAVPIGERKRFQDRWKDFLNYFGVTPSSNTPRQSNENGSVEKSHDLLKRALYQRLRLGGSRDFLTQTWLWLIDLCKIVHLFKIFVLAIFKERLAAAAMFKCRFYD